MLTLPMEAFTAPKLAKFILLFLLIGKGLVGQSDHTRNIPFLEIEFSSREKIIDGNFDDWESPIFTKFYLTNKENLIKDSAEVMLNWDKHYLYGAYHSFDQNLIKEEAGISNEFIWRNDGFEIYIDPKFNADSIMDMNDINIITDLKGDYTIYRSTEEMRNNSCIEVPKSINKVEYYYEVASQLLGSLNDTSDLDNGYQAEFKVPWALMGIIPENGDSMRIDICANDLDIFTKSTDWKSYTITPTAFHQTSWLGSKNFGFPLEWQPIKLIGSPSLLVKLNNKYPSLILTFGLLLFALLSGFLFSMSKQNTALKDILEKSKIQNAVLLNLIASKKTEKITPSKPPKIFIEAQIFLESNLANPIKPADLAKALSMSLRQFQRVCKEELQTTPAIFINLFKIEKAAELLIQSNLSVKEIAFKVGYNDPNYFSKVFKKYFSQTPTQYQINNKIGVSN